MQTCAPLSGSTWSRSTPRNRGATGRRSAGYWNVNAGCGVYLRVTSSPLIRSTRKIVRKNRVSVSTARLASGSVRVADQHRLAAADRNQARLSENRALLHDLVLQPHQAVQHRP